VNRARPVRWGLLALAALVAVVSLALPWSRYVSPGQYIPTTELVTVTDFEGYDTVEIRPGLPNFVPGSLYLFNGFETSAVVLTPMIAAAVVWGLRRGRMAVVRAALVVGLIVPGLAGDWTAGGTTAWLIAVLLAALGSGVLPRPRRPPAANGATAQPF